MLAACVSAAESFRDPDWCKHSQLHCQLDILASTKQREQTKKMALHDYTLRANSDDLEKKISALATEGLSLKTLDLLPDVTISDQARRS